MTALVFIFAFFTRLIGLNQSLWLDEAIVAKVVQTVPLHLIPFSFSPSDFHPPLYYMLMSFWTHIFGYSEIALRFPSVIASLLTGWVVYKIAFLLSDKKKAVWAAAFFLFNPLIIYYSQEARMYMLATLFTTCALYYFLRFIKEKKQNIRDILFFNIFCALSIFTFYGTVFFIAGMIIVGFFVLAKGRDRKERGFWCSFVFLFVGIFVSLLVLFPLLLQQLHVAQLGLVDVPNWNMVLGKAEIKNVAMIFIKFAVGRLSWFPKWNYYLIAGIVTVGTWICVAFGARKNKILILLFFIPLVLAFFVSFWAPMVQYFRFLYLIPVMSLLLAVGVIPMKIGIQKEMWYRFRVKYAMTALFLFFSFLYLLSPQFHREDWKNLAKSLNSKEPVFMILPSSDPISYYNSTVSLFELRNIGSADVPETIQIVPYVENIYGINHVDLLNKKGCLKTESTTFRGPLILEKWKCLKNS